MSKKKIKVSINNIRPNLYELFRKYISRRNEDLSYCQYDDEDLYALGLLDLYDEDEDDYCVLYPSLITKKKHKGKYKKKYANNDIYSKYWEEEENRINKNRHKDKNTITCYGENDLPFSGYEDCPNNEFSDDNGLNSSQWDNNIIIYYYPDYHDENSRIEFLSLKDFDDYCYEKGFYVPSSVGHEISHSFVSHVCLLPHYIDYGMRQIYAAPSYNELFYGVCDNSELSE